MLLPRDLAFEVDVITVESSFADREKAGRILREEGIRMLSYGSLEDRIRASVASEEFEELQPKLQLALERIEPDAGVSEAIAELRGSQDSSATGVSIGAVHVVVETLEVRRDALSAGVTLTNTATGNPWCTSGFAMRRISTGELFMATAAHCRDFGDSLFRNGVLLPLEEYGSLPGAIQPNEDWVLLEVPPPIAPPLGEVWVTSSWQFPIFGPYRSHMSGTSRSKKGITTGYTVGVNLGTFCGYGSSDYVSDGGDSGSPVVYPYGTPRAVGIHSGRCGNQSFEAAIYSQIYNLELGNQSSPEYAVVTGA